VKLLDRQTKPKHLDELALREEHASVGAFTLKLSFFRPLNRGRIVAMHAYRDFLVV
jgi:hypothetical protein